MVLKENQKSPLVQQPDATSTHTNYILTILLIINTFSLTKSIQFLIPVYAITPPPDAVNDMLNKNTLGVKNEAADKCDQNL